MKHVSLFAGMGGFILGMEKHGVETSLCNDIESSCIQTLEHLVGERKVDPRSICDGDLHKRASELGEIDIVSGGFPCQPFSIAGGKQGFQDLERGSRFFDMMAFVDAMPLPPKVLFLENVPNLKTYNGGQWLVDILTALKKRGYWVAPKHCPILNSRDLTNGPQSRDRLYIVAYHQRTFRKNYFKIDAVNCKLKKKPLWSYLDVGKQQTPNTYLDPENKHHRMLSDAMREGGEQRLYQIRRGSVRTNPVDTCPTLTANMGGGGHNVPFLKDRYGIRRLTVSECLKLQGFNASTFSFPEKLSDSAKLKMIGNSVNPDVVSILTEIIIKDIENHGTRMGISA
jgi:DNA (cytosine-5)-methyltransferase 1